MLLLEIIPTIGKVYHLTTLHGATQIITNKMFHLKTDETGRYRFSIARSPQSAFIDLMGGEGSVLLVLSRGRLGANARIRPHSDKDAEDELSSITGNGDEMEDRVYSNKPNLSIRGPINQTIIELRLMGGSAHTGGDNSYSEQQYNQLMHMCQLNKIPVKIFSTDQERQFKYG